MFQFFNKTGIGVRRKHRRVGGGMIRQKHTYREKDKRGEKHTEPNGHRTVFRDLFPNDGDGKIKGEKHHSNHQGYADTALSDNGSQRGSNEEEEQAGQREGEFSKILNLI